MPYYKSQPNIIYLFFPIFVLVISIFFFHNANADNFVYTNQTSLKQGILLSHSQLIGIQVSKVCLKLMEQNITSHCMTYKQLKPLENTIPYLNGDWLDYPYYHHGKPRVDNYWLSENKPFIISVDPSGDFTTRARMIIVQSDNFTWPDVESNSTNGKIVYHVNRSVSNCELATVAPIFWLVNDTINYLESNCTKTSYNDTKILYMKQIPFSYDNPFSSLHYLNYLKNIYHTGFQFSNQTGGSGPQNCINHKCSFKDPFHSHDTRFGW